MLKEDFCGIDVGAKELVVRFRREGEQKTVSRTFLNTPRGRRGVCRHLAKPGHRVRVCLESTGTYGLDLALELDETDGVEVMVNNPQTVRRFAQALMKRGKSDQIDGDVLMEFAQRMPFRRWKRPSATALELRAISRRIKSVTQACTAEKNRLHATSVSKTTPRIVRHDIQQTIARHQKSIARLTAEALKLIAREPELLRNLNLIDTAAGIGQTSAIQILGELCVLSSDLDGRQWVAHAGIDPRHQTSGTSVDKKPRISKAGNKYLRSALFMPALVARHQDPHLRAFGDRLQAKGKAPLQVIVAVMRKLLVGLYGMLKNQQPYDGKKLFALPSPAKNT
jgi:transposase